MIDNLLIKLGASPEFREWAMGKSFKEIHETCPNMDWLLWLFQETNPGDLVTLTRARMFYTMRVRYFLSREKYGDTVMIFGGDQEFKLNSVADVISYICNRYLPLEKWNITDGV